MLIKIIILALVSGAIGTALGGVIGILIKPTKALMGKMLALTAGVMIGISIFDLLPNAFTHGNSMFWGGGFLAVGIGLALGGIFMFILKPRKEQETAIPAINPLHTSDTKKFKRLGFALFVAIILHDLPEGLAVGASAHLSMGSAFFLGVTMLLHNIPEGMAIALPLKAAKVADIKIIGICFVAGLPTLLGAVLGYFIGSIDWLFAYALSFAAGVMLYAAVVEILPAAHSHCYIKKDVVQSAVGGAILVLALKNLLVIVGALLFFMTLFLFG